jgi:hypothetical protein
MTSYHLPSAAHAHAFLGCGAYSFYIFYIMLHLHRKYFDFIISITIRFAYLQTAYKRNMS